MNKFFVFFISFLILFASCSSDIENTGTNNNETNASGKISGTVIYSNVAENQNGGIVVTLDKTDGLNTTAVSKSITNRSLVNSSRTVVSSSTTSADGSYSFSGLEAGTYTVYAVSSYSKEKAVYTNVVVRAAETTVVDALKLIATGSITGTITIDGNYSGNTGFLVFVAGTSFMAMTDDAGNYEISGVPAGKGYQIVATKNGVLHNLSSNVTVNANGTASMSDNVFTTTELEKGLKGETGTTGKDGVDGEDGISMVWLGSFDSSDEIENPKYLNAYFNTTDGCSYIYNGSEWTLLARSGANGADGKDGTSGSGTTIISSGLTSSIGSYAIATLLSTEELTKQDVTITVNITEENLSKVGFVYSESQIDWSNSKSVLTNASFTAITADSEGKYKITAGANGYYTVVARNNEGYVVATEDQISNIDKTAPAGVSGLTAKYTSNTKKITVTWTNPTDSDLDYISLSYTKGGTVVVTDFHTTSPYALNDVEVDGSEYLFSVKAVDKTGNFSSVQMVNVTPAEGVGVQAIRLDRYHFAYNDSNQNITAVATLSNADLLSDDAVVKFQVKDPNGTVTNTVATFDKTAGTATATITAPSASSNFDIYDYYDMYYYSMTYTVLCKIADETADTNHTARFNVSGLAYLENIELSNNGRNFSGAKVQIAVSNVTSSTTEFVKIEGWNLDLTIPSIQLYDSKGVGYFDEPILVDTSSIIWTAENGENSQVIYAEIPVPMTEETYTVKVLFNEVVQERSSRTLQVYGVPKFTSFTIPLVSCIKEDNIVKATIIGKNFDTPDTDLSNFTATCTSKASIVANTSFTKINDTMLTVSFIIPGTAGEYDVTVSYGSQSITSTLKVQDFSTYTYNTGYVLLSDGTIIPYNANNLTFTDEQKAMAVGVAIGTNEYGVPVGWLGIHNSSEGTNRGRYSWSKSNKNFEDIICTPNVSNQSSSTSIATFSGDTDGSDNWAYICSVDPEGTADSATNYPAFNYVNNYATTFGLTGDYATGWYMPSIAELSCIFQNVAVLNTVLVALGGTTLRDDDYWSSSQYVGYSQSYALDVNFGSGYIYSTRYYNIWGKNDSWYVCCMRKFD